MSTEATESIAVSAGCTDGLFLRLDVDDLHFEDQYDVRATGRASGGQGYRAIATSDGHIRFFVDGNISIWKRIPFLDFVVGDPTVFVEFVAIGGGCSGNSHPSLLAYSNGYTAHAFAWDKEAHQWTKIGTLQPKKGGTYWRKFDRLHWESRGNGVTQKWFLYA